MAAAGRDRPGRGVGFHLLAVPLTLVAAEAIGMVCVAPLVPLDEGWIVLAGLAVLPLWASLLALVHTADRRWRALGVLALVTVVSALLLWLR